MAIGPAFSPGCTSGGFTSSSTVSNFATLAEKVEDVQQFRCAVIGPITAATARRQGLKIVVQAEKSSVPDLVSAIEQYFQQLPA